MNYFCKAKFWSAIEYITTFFTGAVTYFLIELIYRGYSHITMFFAGGICFFLIYICEKHTHGVSLPARCISYAFIITSVELVFGVIFNIILGLGVWDYSNQPFNILGQICPGFITVWIVLSLPAIFFCCKIRQFFEKASFRVK